MVAWREVMKTEIHLEIKLIGLDEYDVRCKEKGKIKFDSFRFIA